jgi:hypothetical protein
MTTIFKPSHSHGVDWQCSLRQQEYEMEYDGIVKLKNPTAVENNQSMKEDSLEGKSEFTMLSSNRDYLS